MIDEMLSEQLDSTSKRPRLDSPESVEVGALPLDARVPRVLRSA